MPDTDNTAPETEAATAESESITAAFMRHPGLVLLGGVAVGVAAAALLPRSTVNKAGKKVAALATTAGKLGLEYSKAAREKAEDAAQEGLGRVEALGDTLAKGGAKARKQAVELTDETSELVRKAGLALARHALDIVTRTRK